VNGKKKDSWVILDLITRKILEGQDIQEVWEDKKQKPLNIKKVAARKREL